MDYNINKISYLLIPNYHNQESLYEIIPELDAIIQDNEIILHGYNHISRDFKFYDYRRLLTNKEAEFLLEKNLDQKIDIGLKILRDLGRLPKGFIAPAWLMRKDCFALLKLKGFLFTTDRRYIYDLKTDNKIFSPVISFGSRGFIKDISIMLFDKQFYIYKKLKVVRIAIHPIDIKEPIKIKKLTKILQNIQKSDFIVCNLEHIINIKIVNEKLTLKS